MHALRALFALSLVALLQAPAFGHVFAVYTTHSLLNLEGDPHGETPASTVAYIGWGHRMPLEEILSPDRLQRYAVIAPDGEETPLVPSGPGFLAVEFSPEVEGPHIVAGAYKDDFYTWYIEDGEEKSGPIPKTGLEEVVYSGYFEMRGKALVGVGRTDADAFTQPIGDTLEIVPVENPLRKTGAAFQTLSVRVLFRGEPLADARVHARYNGHFPTTDFAQAVTTDEDGVATIDLTHKGGWLLKVEHDIPPRPELADQADIEQFFATLAFEIP